MSCPAGHSGGDHQQSAVGEREGRPIRSAGHRYGTRTVISKSALGVSATTPASRRGSWRSDGGHPVQLGTAGTLPTQLLGVLAVMGELVVVMVPPWR